MENVVEKILREAEKEAEEIISKYKSETERITNEYQEKLANERKRIEEEVNNLKEMEIARILSKEKIFLNKHLNLELENQVNGIIQEAIKGLPEEKDYLNFLKRLIKKSGEKEGEILLSKKDLLRYKDEIEKFIKQEGMNFTIREEKDISGGVIIKRERVAYLGSLDVIVEMLRDELKIVIVKSLFGDDAPGIYKALA